MWKLFSQRRPEPRVEKRDLDILHLLSLERFVINCLQCGQVWRFEVSSCSYQSGLAVRKAFGDYSVAERSGMLFQGTTMYVALAPEDADRKPVCIDDSYIKDVRSFSDMMRRVGMQTTSGT